MLNKFESAAAASTSL